MEVNITLKDVPFEDGIGCQMTIKTAGTEPADGTKLADIPSAAFLIAIQHLHKTGEYLTIASEAMSLAGQQNDSETNKERP